MRYRWRWALGGLALAAVYVLADMVLQWRGAIYRPWVGDNIAENLGHLAGSFGIFFLVAFLLGYAKDRASARRAAAALPTLPPENGDGSSKDWYLFVEDVEYGPLSIKQLLAYAETHGLSTAHVWRPGTAGWVPANDVAELRLALQEGPDEHPQARSRNWIARYWRGDLPLWLSYWVISFIINLTTPALAAGIALLFKGNTYQPLRSFSAIVAVWLVALIITAWQLVGLWRSARHYRAAKVRAGKWGVWGIAAQMAVVLGAVTSTAAFVKEGVPQLNEIYAIAFRGDPDIPDFSIRVMRDGTEAEIVGGFKFGLTEAFAKVVAASANISVVHLDSNGGRIGEGEALYNLIKQRGLITYVRANCMSACTLAFAGGRERYIARSATLGFHRGAFPGTEDGVQDYTQREIFTAAGFDAKFIDNALSTPHSSMFRPAADVLLSAHVITAVTGDDRFAYSGLGRDLSKETMSKGLARLPTLAAIRDRFPEQFDALVSDYRAGVISGKTEAATIGAMRAQLGPFIKSRIPEADDDVVIDSYRLVTEELKALRSKNPAWCYHFAYSGETSFHHEIPQALQDREARTQERAIRTAAKRPPAAAEAANATLDKVFERMRQNGATDDDVALLAADQVEIEKQPRYCDLAIGFHEELEKLPRDDGVVAMRFLMEAK